MKLIRKLSGQDLLLLAGTAVFNFIVYGLGRLLAQGNPHYCLELPIDHVIPLLPWTILIYWGCYIFWIVNYCLCTAGKSGRRFLAAHYMGELICFLIFILFPTVMNRPEITGTTVFDILLKMTYTVDQPDNLLPSIHCFVSWLCWIGVRRDEEIPGWYRGLSLAMAVAVCISTLTVKQHVIVDVVAGVLLAEISYAYCEGKKGISKNGRSMIK